MSPRVATMAFLSMSAALGCARDRDFARVDATLARPYAADEPVVVAPATLAARPAQTYGVGQDRTPLQPVTAAPAPAPMTAAVAPPTSSTAQQPYYYVPVSGTQQATPTPLPAPAVQPPAPMTAPTVAPASAPLVVQAGATMPTNVGAGVYPVQPVGMWQPTGTAAPVPAIAMQSTGSSFNPRDPAVGRVDTSTGSSLTQAPGQVLPAGATVPFATAIPNNAPPPMNQRPAFLSESGERGGSRLPPPRSAAEPATPLNSNDATDVPERPRKRNDPPGPTILEGDREEGAKKAPSFDDLGMGKRETDAPPAAPPRGKSAPPMKRIDALPMDPPPAKSKETPKSVEPPKPDDADLLLFGDRPPAAKPDAKKRTTEDTPKSSKKAPAENAKTGEIDFPSAPKANPADDPLDAPPPAPK